MAGRIIKTSDFDSKVAMGLFQLLNPEKVKIKCLFAKEFIVTDEDPENLYYPEGWYYSGGYFTNNTLVKVFMEKSDGTKWEDIALHCTNN